ncbi:MAG TPA: hypothetical protein DD670_20205 [Planctomycetaceae bacterium]|nr:hypothetical protein [Planctomycetaceae bacterium]
MIHYEASEDKKNQTVPELNVEPLAKTAKLKFVRTGLVTVAELEGTDIGLSGDGESESFAQKVFGGLPTYLPDVSWDVDANQYLFWKTEQTEQRVPEFTDEGIRDKVLAAWRLVQSREKAQSHAESLADEARKSGLSLEDSIGKRDDIRVARTGEFTWITSETTAATQYRAQLRFGTVENVDQPGPDFMKAAYALKQGEIGVAMNQPQTAVYIMRLVETTPSEKYLVAMFETDPYYKYRAIGDGEKQKMLFAWISNLREEAGLEWKERLETPDQP